MGPCTGLISVIFHCNVLMKGQLAGVFERAEEAGPAGPGPE